MSWCGPAVELGGGALTLLVGVSVLLWLGLGPTTCPGSGGPCFGLLGPTMRSWLDYPSFATIWIPLAGVVVVGAGAVQNAVGKASAIARFRWVATLCIAVPTLLLLIASPLGMVMIPVTLAAYVTGAVGQLRAQRGEAPASVAAPVLGGLATLAVAAVAFHTVEWLNLILRT